MSKSVKGNNVDAIIIEGLKVETVVGCFNWERQIIQPLMLDMIIQTDLEQASNSDDLDHTLNYAEICEIAAKVIQDAKPELIEHAANWSSMHFFLPFMRLNRLILPSVSLPLSRKQIL